MNFGTVRNDALERWKQLADPCGHSHFFKLPNAGIEAPLMWQLLGYPISCQWQVMAGSAGFGHISIFCSVWEWAANLTDLLLDCRFDDYAIGQQQGDSDQDASDIDSIFHQNAPEVLARHYFRTLIIAAEILEDLTILRKSMSDCSGAKKNARTELSQSSLPVDTLIKYVNTICKHKGDLHGCNHHLPKRFLDEDPSFDLGRYQDWKYLHSFIEIPRYVDIIETVIGAFKKVDQLLRLPDSMKKVGDIYGKHLGTKQESVSTDG
ncbi:MAG: hypothetical protein U1F71_19430 [Verrucomicrobiaceae bacterium]